MRQRRPQAFSADPVSCFPDYDHRLSHRLIINAPASYRTRCIFTAAELSQQPDAVLAVVSSYGNELIKDPALVLLGALSVTVPYCSSNSCFAILLKPPPTWLTPDFSVTFYLRQLLSAGNVIIEAMRTWMPTALQGGGPARLSLLQHLIQWQHNRVTFMLNTKLDIYAGLRQCCCSAIKFLTKCSAKTSS